MKGYSKIKANNSFIQRSKSNKEFLFLDTDFDLLSSKSTNKKSHLVHDEQESNIPDQVITNNKKVGFSLEKEEYDGRDLHSGEKTGGVLRRNFSISSANSTYKKNNNKGNSNNYSYLERQSSTRAIQEAVKRAFSVKRCSSVNSDRYCRIYDQPNMNFDENDGKVYVNYDDVNGMYDHHDDDFERNGSLDTRYVSMMKNSSDHHNHGKRHVGSKVVRACKRLFSL